MWYLVYRYELQLAQLGQQLTRSASWWGETRDSVSGWVPTPARGSRGFRRKHRGPSWGWPEWGLPAKGAEGGTEQAWPEGQTDGQLPAERAAQQHVTVRPSLTQNHRTDVAGTTQHLKQRGNLSVWCHTFLLHFRLIENIQNSRRRRKSITYVIKNKYNWISF